MKQLPRSTGVFVVGGGPAGLAAAIAARARGFDVIVADSANPPIDKACGEGIMPDGIAAARSLGIDVQSAPGARTFPGIRFCDGGSGARVEARFPQGHGVGLRRTMLHQIMVERAVQAGVTLAWGAHVTSLADGGVVADGQLVRARWIVGADGGHSPVRRWADLDASHCHSRRYGFRRHYRVLPSEDSAAGDFMEIHWGDDCQLYITPTGHQEACVVLISRDPQLRLGDALPRFPELALRLLEPSTSERGGVTATRRLKSVCRKNIALVGDASGSVDAITGEGLCLLFQQAVALAEALEAGDLSLYKAEHRRIGKRPAFMGNLMLLLDGRNWLRRRVLSVMESYPALFARMLALHVGESPLTI